ncbi:hypothetical protein [Methanospirillum lacunae]
MNLLTPERASNDTTPWDKRAFYLVGIRLFSKMKLFSIAKV